MKKTLDTSAIKNELHGASGFFKPVPQVKDEKPKEIQILAQKDEQVSNLLSKPLSNPSNMPKPDLTAKSSTALPKKEAIELMSFQLRNARKTKVNTQIAEEWKGELEEIAFKLHIGKYELVEYIIGQFLGKLPKE